MTTLTRTESRPDVHEMVVIHRVFRREFSAIPHLVRRVADGDTARAGIIGGHLSLILAGLHMHHTGEDERSRMLAHLPGPVRLVMRTIGARQYRRYITRVRAA